MLEHVELAHVLSQVDVEGIPALTMALGSSQGDESLFLRLSPNLFGNVLVAGDSGSGKGDLLRSLILSLGLLNRQRDLQMAIIDRRGGLDALAGLPHLFTPIVSNEVGARDLLGYLIENRRAGSCEPASARATNRSSSMPASRSRSAASHGLVRTNWCAIASPATARSRSATWT